MHCDTVTRLVTTASRKEIDVMPPLLGEQELTEAISCYVTLGILQNACILSFATDFNSHSTNIHIKLQIVGRILLVFLKSEYTI
jgi:hypothetical protein